MPGDRSEEPVYNSVDAVQVPNNVAAGEEFIARVWAKQRGQRVAKAKQFWRGSSNAPVIVQPQVATAEGPRHAQRPSAVARHAANGAHAVAMDHIQSQPCNVTQWHTSVELPVEVNAADVGWLAGPVNGISGRAMPTFTGLSSGPRDNALTSRSTARAIMRSVQFSRGFKQQVIELAQQHQQRWAAEHAGRDGTERAFKAANLQPVHVELWFAIAARVAKLNPAIPAEKLWDAQHHCYDATVDAACTHTQWQWFSRHMSFGVLRQVDADSDGDGDSDSDGASSDGSGAPHGARPDRHRSRRLVSDLARAQAAKAFRPGQHLGFDDLVRVTRHADGRRVRHKAAVHTGRANDGLNDARSHYFMWWEEQGWLREDEVLLERAACRAVMAALLHTMISLMPFVVPCCGRLAPATGDLEMAKAIVAMMVVVQAVVGLAAQVATQGQVTRRTSFLVVGWVLAMRRRSQLTRLTTNPAML